MSTPPLFDTEPTPVKGQPWPWTQPDGFDTLSHTRCTAIRPGRWNYCHREPGHADEHAESNSAGNVTAVWGQA